MFLRSICVSKLRTAFPCLYVALFSLVRPHADVIIASKSSQPNHMSKLFSAFISYSTAYSTWVAALHHDLEACGERVFLDQTDLAPGPSWVQQLQRGLDRAERVILVVTPETMASPRAADEWIALVAAHRDYKTRGLLQLAMLVDTPLPPFLADIQYVDFREHDDTRYLAALRELLCGLRSLTRRNLPALPPGIVPPKCPKVPVPPRLRRRLVQAVASACDADASRMRLRDALGLDPGDLEGYPSAESTASAVLTLLLRGTADTRQAYANLLPLSTAISGPEVDAILDELARMPVTTTL